jgi:hypothetical protein
MTKRTRQIFAAVAFAAIAAAGVAGATLRGETREAPTVAEACASAEWPNIPAQCLTGEVNTNVRVINGSEAAPQAMASAEDSLRERFEVAFQ